MLAVWLTTVFSVASADIKLPEAPVVPQPMPDKPVYFLAADDRYPVNSDAPLIVRSYPSGLIDFKTAKPGTHHWETAGVEKSFDAGPNALLGRALKSGRVEVEFFWAEKDQVKTRRVLIDCLVAPIPPPVPPDPKPPEPKPPEPVSSFRVVFVVETGDTPTADHSGVIYGGLVEDFLNHKCTGGRKGWFRRDKDADVNRLDSTMQALWKAVQPKVTTTPCVAVEVNGKVEIINLEPTQTQMIQKFRTYLGGK